MSDTKAAANPVARFKLESVDKQTVCLGVPGTEYRLTLVPTVAPKKVKAGPGGRIKGVVEARALRMHAAEGGGRFIEPVYGAPRIVAGTVLAVDEVESRLLVDVSVPMWVTMHADQSASDFSVGQLVNFYVQSGTTFTPA